MKYNTDINIIGSIPNYNLIYRYLPLLIDGDKEIYQRLVTENEYNFRTEKSRKRFLSALSSAFISNSNTLNEIARKTLSYFDKDEKSQALIIFWLFSINNRLFFELNRDVFFKNFYQGRAELPRYEVEAYLKDLIHNNAELKGRWSEKTVQTIASKYLTLMKKLFLLEGSSKKTFCFVHLNDELLAIFIHIYLARKNWSLNLFDDDFTIFSFVTNDALVERLKKIGKKNWIKMNYTGTSLKVESVFDPNNITDGIFRRS